MIAFGYATVTLWSIHGYLPSTFTSEQTDDWQQPIAASTLFPNTISAQQWHFDYESTEKILSKVEFTNTGELLINPKLVSILTKVINSLPQDMSEKALLRVGFLISKSFPHLPHEAKKLTDVLINFYHLQYASNKVQSIENNPQNSHKKLQAFLGEETRQNYYLGKDVATQLFGKQRAITRYLLERKVIKENPELNTHQKNQQLDALSKPTLNTVKGK
mgnify:CR=1 FL=1